MRIPYGWLTELVAPLPGVHQTADLLAGLGLGVETIEEMPGAPEGVRVVSVTAVAPIPGRDGPSAVTIDDAGVLRTVVCGAPDVRVGMRAAYAPPGVTLPGMAPLATRVVAGVTSEGMLCSPRELGLFDVASGLLALGDDAPVGASLADLWPPESVIVLELTPNRADAFSLLGVARDLAAKLDRPLVHPAADLPDGDPHLNDGLSIEWLDAERCPHVTLRRIDDVKATPSPVWLQRRLAHLGSRPRNVIVDVTNYVTFELGQPSHAYDLAALHGGVLQVRRAQAGERLVTLALDDLALDPDDLVIATPTAAGGSAAIGLAGVIGGRDDSVGDDTVSVALEVAWFEPTGVRRTARRHKLVTDARIRFERGVDPALARAASARVCHLLTQHAGARVHPGIRVAGAPAAARAQVFFRPERVEFLTGVAVDPAVQRAYLERLGCRVAIASDGWSVTPPSWRVDLGLDVDLIEEVVRLHGYEHIGVTTPALSFVPPATDPTHRRLRERLVGMGHVEAIGYAFTGEADLARARVERAQVHLSEPQGVDRAVLRTSLIPGLLAVARLNRDAAGLALFEIGRVFTDREEERVALLWRGARSSASWRAVPAADAYVAKGVLESLAEGFGVGMSLVQRPVPHLHPGVAATVVWDGVEVGTFGRLHPEVAAEVGCGDLMICELRLPLTTRPPALRELPRQPFAERDLAVVVPERIAYADLRDLCWHAAGERLVELFPFDLYAGAQVAPGHKSVALRFRFRHEGRALTDPEVDAAMEGVIAALTGRGFTLRA